MQKVFTFVLVVCLIGCSDSTEPLSGDDTSKPTATIYHNGPVLTMAKNTPSFAEALVEADGKILFVGGVREARERFPLAAKEFDLQGSLLMPGLIEPHLHPSLAAVMLQNEIIAPYDWKLPSGVKKGVSGEQNYQERLAQSVAEHARPGEMYFVWGFHQLWHGFLSREVLNRIAGDQPIGVIHRSFHEIYLNDAAIELLGIEEAQFKNNPQVNWRMGHFYEGGWLALVPVMAPVLLDPEKYGEGLATMTKILQQNGITTIAEPGFPSSDFDAELFLLKAEMKKRPPYDVYLIPSGTQLYSMKGGNSEALAFIETLATNPAYNTPNLHFLPKQVKLFADGAIYSQLMQMKDGYTDGHEGEWMTPLSLFQEQVALYWRNDYKIHVHANGDLGQQMVIDHVERLQAEHPRSNHRFTLHHMGYFTADMAAQMAALGIEASVNPYYLWALADKYAEYGLGRQRAENLVALNLLVERDVPMSFHSDFSMAPAEPLTLAWTAVNRETSMKTRMSQDQRIAVYDALKAITVDAARALNLETEVGSLEAGKIANFTILGENPLDIDPMGLKDIEIKGVVHRGRYVGNEVLKQSQDN
ncbi:MAG: amidohydrolase [Pseudomonadales bacterium]|nr:amidohydrolase [Pseudomonadales bacterium]MBO6564336.1 amidohydrolase [Pseudomonadales bacterium]MBO6596395.1 amidohydrolase [Pseudomonadales bacterium]MBO6822875.1 amidohydrolase [Pseudomonadales bacterium]